VSELQGKPFGRREVPSGRASRRQFVGNEVVDNLESMTFGFIRVQASRFDFEDNGPHRLADPGVWAPRWPGANCSVLQRRARWGGPCVGGRDVLAIAAAREVLSTTDSPPG